MAAMPGLSLYNDFPHGEPVIVVKHGALSKSHVYRLLRSKDARVRRAAFTLLEVSNPGLRTSSEVFVEITRFIWDANPSYDLYREFTKRHFQINYKVHELVSARIKIEKQNDRDPADKARRYQCGFFKRLLGFARPAAMADTIARYHGSRQLRGTRARDDVEQ